MFQLTVRSLSPNMHSCLLGWGLASQFFQKKSPLGMSFPQGILLRGILKIHRIEWGRIETNAKANLSLNQKLAKATCNRNYVPRANSEPDRMVSIRWKGVITGVNPPVDVPDAKLSDRSCDATMIWEMCVWCTMLVPFRSSPYCLSVGLDCGLQQTFWMVCHILAGPYMNSLPVLSLFCCPDSGGVAHSLAHRRAVCWTSHCLWCALNH